MYGPPEAYSQLLPPLLFWRCLVLRFVMFRTVVKGIVLDAFVIVLLSLVFGSYELMDADCRKRIRVSWGMGVLLCILEI